MKVLLDTNVVSEARKPRGNPGVRRRLAELDEFNQFLSVVSIGEIAYGVARLARGKLRDALELWLAQAERSFADRLLPVDAQVAGLWGELAARSAAAGGTISLADGLIAATAIHHGMRLMTRNVADFASTGGMLINPWEE
ncbi:Toxin FitB [Pirellulimonas nuda]|uniref:Ribonuclease VapC n=1 Tax=Pirellulimonas nuda TaxID=2528009 RepID=A0A518DHM4_9BACT|nr:type II toxin-antitoxin system VapC family toxin [Pirellulimonas nuda]QDU90978.1 Toxin FitB [Pirellulimonas nuda]